MTAVGIAGMAFVILVVGVAFGLAWGLAIAEPRYTTPQLHEGRWDWVGLNGTMATWKRQEPRRKNCHDHHRAYVCTIVPSTGHVDACDCGKTRQGVFGQWC